MKIFYSWQSDTPPKTGRYLIRDALKVAINELHKELLVEEAARSQLDYDTRGLLGSPPIADAILQKIDMCDVFVADVTLVGDVRWPKRPAGEDTKALINSNVGIELGYALKSKGHEVLVMVLNTEHGSRDDLPFDLKHWRGPVEFSLHEDPDREEIENTKEELAQKLKPILRAYIKAGPKQPRSELFSEIPTTVSPAHYFDLGEELVPASVQYGWRPSQCSEEVLLYVRIHPKHATAPLPERKVRSLIDEEEARPMCDGLGGYTPIRNRFGGIVYSSDRDRGEILSATQLFLSREIWGFDAITLSHFNEHRGQSFRVIPSEICAELAGAVKRYLSFAKNGLEYPLPVIVEAGASNAEGAHILVRQDYSYSFPGPVHKSHIRKRCELNNWSEEEINRILLEIYDEFFDSVGADRPEGLNDFPP